VELGISKEGFRGRSTEHLILECKDGGESANPRRRHPGKEKRQYARPLILVYEKHTQGPGNLGCGKEGWEEGPIKKTEEK